MFVQVLSSSIFLPFLVMSMIIAQIHLEKYWDDNNARQSKNHWYIFYIIFIYVAQEICLMELTLVNLNIMAFTIVIPITMILRNRHQIWLWLLLATPVISAFLDIYLKRYQFINWNAIVVQLILTAGICWLLLRWKRPPYYVKYSIALYSNALIHILRLTIEHQLQLNFVITILLGNLFIILAENSRRYYELKQEEEVAKLHYESVRDDLTGLLNYRAFDQDMKRLSQEQDSKVILMVILDIDHFKKVNDTYGHLNGNLVLHAFSERLRATVHNAFDPDCAVYRFGGEEFTIVVEGQSYAKVIRLLNSINYYYSNHPVKTHDGQNIYFSFSGGLTKHLQGENLNQTLARADSLVYQAKNSGRKKILFD